METFLSFLQIFGANLVFVLLMAAVVLSLAMWRRPAYAVLKRNFLAYFTSPIGYVFLCLFVCLTAVAAFWSEDFFNANLANLDQLNRYLPLILLVFIPAITMSIWSDERRQGTDELLLTIPAADFDIVLGKYLAAVAIYTVSLIFSQFCNFIVLSTLGTPDIGLLLGNYLGYWLAGLAMLAIGMVASFLTNNLTVGFVLGALFNVPLVMARYADVLVGPELGRVLARWSIDRQFADFKAGVVSFASVAFFLMVAGVMFYLSLVLIGRRHWSGGRDGHSLGLHYLARGVSLIVAVGAMCVLLARWDPVRADLTSERLNSLHPKTIQLLSNINPKYTVRVDAFVSRDLPKEFAERRVDLANMLREINALGHGKVRAVMNEVDPFSKEAALAKAEYGIDVQKIFTNVRGAITQRDIIFGVGVRSGLERVSIPFLGQGARIEPELVRAVVTVADATAVAESKSSDGKSDAKKSQGRKRVGVLTTDVPMFGGGRSPFGEEEGPDQPLIQELRRQYKVVQVNPEEPIERFDVLVAAQPSSLSPTGMKNLVAAIRSGQPTAIFEDPLPLLFNGVPGTAIPKRPPQGMMGMMQGPTPKGPIKDLWDVLGVRLRACTDVDEMQMEPSTGPCVVWQEYNPHESDKGGLVMTHQWVFAGPGSGAVDALSPKSPATSGLQEVLMFYPGALEQTGGVNQQYTELIRTGPNAGSMKWDKIMQYHPMMGLMPVPPFEVLRQEKLSKEDKSKELVLAYHVQRPPAAGGASDDGKGTAGKGTEGKDGGLNVIVVAAVDVLSGEFFFLRNLGDNPLNQLANWNLDNVPLVLNIIDTLADDNRFIDIRKRRPRHRELTAITSLAERAKVQRREARISADEEFEKQYKKEEKALQAKVDELKKRTDIDFRTKQQQASMAGLNLIKRLKDTKDEQDRQREAQDRKIEGDLAARVQDVQDRYKILAVVLPPLLPLMIALCVFIVRRSQEGEGVSSDRIV